MTELHWVIRWPGGTYWRRLHRTRHAAQAALVRELREWSDPPAATWKQAYRRGYRAVRVTLEPR